MNPYHVLGVPPDADNAALQTAYRKLVRLHHPDLAPDEAARQAASERMVKINWAWHVVSDACRRAAFDAHLRAQQTEAARRQQDALRAQTQGQVVRAQHAHLNDVLRAQALRRQQQKQRAGRQRAQVQVTQAQAAPSRAQTAQENMRAQQFLEWQIIERARQQREAKASATRPLHKRLSREEKKRDALAHARLKRMRREDKKRSSAPSARRQLADAAKLFGQAGRAGEAIAICHNVLRVDGRNVPARELLGDFYLRLGREDRALPLWEQALVLQPDNSSVRRKLNSLRPHDPRPLRATPPPCNRDGRARERAPPARAKRRLLGTRAQRSARRLVNRKAGSGVSSKSACGRKNDLCFLMFPAAAPRRQLVFLR